MSSPVPIKPPVFDFAFCHWYIILFMGLIGSVMTNPDSSQVNIVIPFITTSLHAALADTQWVITGYMLITSSLFIIRRRIPELVGVSRLLGIRTLVFTINPPGCTASRVSTTAGCISASPGVSFSSLILTMELNLVGYHGHVLSAGTTLLSHPAGWISTFTSFLHGLGIFAPIILNTSDLWGDGNRGFHTVLRSEIPEFRLWRSMR